MLVLPELHLLEQRCAHRRCAQGEQVCTNFSSRIRRIVDTVESRALSLLSFAADHVVDVIHARLRAVGNLCPNQEPAALRTQTLPCCGAVVANADHPRSCLSHSVSDAEGVEVICCIAHHHFSHLFLLIL